MNHMVVYTNQKGTKFLSVTNNEFYNEDELELLRDDGEVHFHFYPSREQDQDLDDLRKTIANLPLEQEIELANKVTYYDKHDGQDRYNLDKARKDYQTNLLAYHDREFDEAEFIDDFKYGNANVLHYNLAEEFTVINYDQMATILDFLKEKLDPKHFRYWYVIGYNQGDYCYVWVHEPTVDLSYLDGKNEDDLENDYQGSDFAEQLQNLLFGSFIDLVSCNQHGETLDDPKIERTIPGYVFNQDQTNSNNDLNEYIFKNYNLKPAKATITYSAPDEKE